MVFGCMAVAPCSQVCLQIAVDITLMQASPANSCPKVDVRPAPWMPDAFIGMYM
jgi:hypothetical protein